jgi:ribosomal RNA-processing protein 12
MAETETGRIALKSNLEELIRHILDTTATATAVKRARLSLISHVVSFMNPTSWNIVPSILSEVIVATKEVNGKTRDVAYNHSVAVSNKMKAGGISSERVSATWKEHLARPWPQSVNALQW